MTTNPAKLTCEKPSGFNVNAFGKPTHSLAAHGWTAAAAKDSLLHPLEVLIKAYHEFALGLAPDETIVSIWTLNEASNGFPRTALLARRLSEVLDRESYVLILEPLK